MAKFGGLNLGLAVIVLGLLQSWSWVDVKQSQSTDHAYVTLLYGDEFLLGVRVLGKSLRDNGTDKDMVVLVSDGVSDYAKQLLQVSGDVTYSGYKLSEFVPHKTFRDYDQALPKGEASWDSSRS